MGFIVSAVFTGSELAEFDRIKQYFLQIRTSHELITILQPFSVYFLVFHGSHDPRSKQAAKQLTEEFRQRITYTPQITQATGSDLQWASDRQRPSRISPDELDSKSSRLETTSSTWVYDVYLECTSLPLHQQMVQGIEQLNLSADQREATSWQAVPVFLLAGTHVMQDIPAEMTAVQTDLEAPIPLTITPHVGSHLGLRRVLNERMSLHPMEAWVLVAHGSRQAGANQAIEQLAEHVGAVTAYWSTEPGLAQRIAELSDLGLRNIGILPYFLFSGGITDAIAQTMTQLTQQFPDLTLTLTPPLEVNRAELADLLVDLATTSAPATAATLLAGKGQDEA